MASGTVNGSNNSPESVSYAHNMDHDLDYLDMVNTLETTSLNSQKASTMVLLFINDYFKEYQSLTFCRLQKSCLVGSTPFDPKKSKVTVQRPGEQKAYQCGPNSKKNKKSDSVSCFQRYSVSPTFFYNFILLFQATSAFCSHVPDQNPVIPQ